jgi:hypothetical protein
MFSLNSPRRPERRQISEFASHILDLNFDCQKAQAPLLWEPTNLLFRTGEVKGCICFLFTASRRHKRARKPASQPSPPPHRLSRRDPHLSDPKPDSQPPRRESTNTPHLRSTRLEIGNFKSRCIKGLGAALRAPSHAAGERSPTRAKGAEDDGVEEHTPSADRRCADR